jgi:Cu(I)-responsive transcriptional regulator
MSRPMNIGEAAKVVGVSAKMIRHYEQLGLMPKAARTDAGYRQYTGRDISILRFIRQSRLLGFSMAQIADLLGLWIDDRRASREVKALAQNHLDALEIRMGELAEMQRALTTLVASCHGDDDPNCAILDELAASSAERPDRGMVGAKPSRPVAMALPRKQASPAAPSTYSDLMAWTRNIHAGHEHH